MSLYLIETAYGLRLKNNMNLKLVVFFTFELFTVLHNTCSCWLLKRKASPWTLYRGQKKIFFKPYLLVWFTLCTKWIVIKRKKWIWWIFRFKCMLSSPYFICTSKTSALHVVIVLFYYFTCMCFQYPFILYLDYEHWDDALCMLSDTSCNTVILLMKFLVYQIQIWINNTIVNLWGYHT